MIEDVKTSSTGSDGIPTEGIAPDSIPRARTGAQPARPAEVAAPVVEVRGLTVRYDGGTVAVDGVDLTVPAGGITALVGSSGCGKTSLLRAIAGFEEPVAGEVWVAGRCVSKHPVSRHEAGRRRARRSEWVKPEKRRIAMVFQEGALFPHLTVEGNVAYGLSGDAVAKRQRVAEVLELVGLPELADRYPDELSGGQQQRVALARALAPEPRLVLLDEPFANLDAALREHLREEVRRILAAAGATAVLVTHDQAEALSVADTVAVMERGRILQVGGPEEVYHGPTSPSVARFLGEGQMVPCRIEAGTLTCVFGDLPTDAADGEARLLVRPEDLAMMPEGYQHGPLGEVVRRRFFGHDLIDEVAVDGVADPIWVRLLSSVPHPVGSRVRLVLRPKSFQLFRPDSGEVTSVRLPPH